MSMTPINYNLVVKELSNGLVALDSDEAKRLNFRPGLDLSEFRTIRYGAGRQRGVTAHAVDMAAKHRGSVLYLVHAVALRDEVVEKFHAKASGDGWLTVHSGYLPENWQNATGSGLSGYEKFSLVIVDEAGFFFNKFSFDKIYRSLADVVTPDVVIHLIN
ncbi:hypothetical protein ASESINO_254 [Erwinia phage vB_EamM_Asesino]|uniref:Uncharacterized protein n=1 Tax=Erwinia phage vB_EamM_Asesino TaxID=1883370 RepID=A0A1B2IAH2_9CAUD|nr:hypothetical protein ASESINO_254 [Erwinia phage vB_EamM_Asesino]ANZ48267.1 hypothetical protein ASESINO_254 [Erwinia phage vB_EamM_Asesino]